MPPRAAGPLAHSHFDDRPLGVFDSGIGGLTVLRSLWAAFPHESFLYLGDTARLPYGSKSPETIERYLRQNIEFLAQQGVKAIVVACNSVSTVLLDKEFDFPVPVYNVIEPGARASLLYSRSKQIGVLGTKATVSAQSYVHQILRLEPHAKVFQQACPLLVPLVEEGWESESITGEVVARYLKPLLEARPAIDTLILGCTHYPALREVIGSVAGPLVRLVDSAEAILQDIRLDFTTGLVMPSSARRLRLQIATTDISPGFLEVARRLMQPEPVPELVRVDL